MQSAEVLLDGKTTVPDAVDKSKKAMVSFEKQVEDIKKKFSTAFKDIFLGFTAPMVIIQNVIGYISDAIAKAKQDAQDGLDLLAKGETTYADSDTKKMAAFFKAKKAREDEQESVRKGKEELTKQFLETDAGKGIISEYKQKYGLTGKESGGMMLDLHKNAEIQKKALEAFLASPEGKAFAPIFNDKASFKGPEGFSNVVGVGANPVIEAMTRQVDIQNEILQIMKNSIPAGRPLDVPDFTKKVPLTLQKAGIA